MRLSRLLAYEYLKWACHFSGYKLPSRKAFKAVTVVMLDEEALTDLISRQEVEFNYDIGNHDVAGFLDHDVDTDTYIVYVWDHVRPDWTEDEAYKHMEATLIHELVHYLQHTNDVPAENIQRVESEAYDAQRKYMQMIGYIGLSDELEEFVKEEGYVS